MIYRCKKPALSLSRIPISIRHTCLSATSWELFFQDLFYPPSPSLSFCVRPVPSHSTLCPFLLKHYYAVKILHPAQKPKGEKLSGPLWGCNDAIIRGNYKK